MYSILQETTNWSGGYSNCNHTYLLDNDKIVAYVKHGDTTVIQLKSRMRIDKRYRTFIKVNNPALSKLIPKSTDTRLFKVKSNDKEYMVELDSKNRYTCTCTGFMYRAKCKHIEAVKAKQ